MGGEKTSLPASTMIALARRTALVLVRAGRSSVDVEEVDKAYGWWEIDRLIDGRRLGVSGDGESCMLDEHESGKVRGSGCWWEWSPVAEDEDSEGSVSRKSCMLAATFRREVDPACAAGRGDSLPDDEDEADSVGEGGASECCGRPDEAVEEDGNEGAFVEVEGV